MPKVLILSKQGDGVPLAIRLAEEGHGVDIYIQDSKAKGSLKGYERPRVIDRPTRVKDKAYDLVLADMVGLGMLCEEFSKAGHLVLGGGLLNDKLELDRDYGTKVIEKLTKVKEADSVKCTTVEQINTLLAQSVHPKVIKPLGNKTVDLTLVSGDDENRSLKTIVGQWGDKLIPCIVQEMIKGVEISTEGWFNGKEFIKPFNHTFERKRLMEGDKGPQTGCMGNIVIPSQGDRLTEMALKPLEPLLEKAGYVGPIDVNCILSGNDAYFLEFTTRFGYDAIQAWTELLKMPLFDFLFHVASGGGDLVKNAEYRNDYAIAVRLSVAPYPSHKGAEQWKGIQVLNLEDPQARRHVWLSDVMRNGKTQLMAGVDGVIGCVTARGISIGECRNRVYRTINNIVIHKDVQYRRDIGEGVEMQIGQFKRWCDAKD